MADGAGVPSVVSSGNGEQVKKYEAKKSKPNITIQAVHRMLPKAIRPKSFIRLTIPSKPEIGIAQPRATSVLRNDSVVKLVSR